MKNYRSLKGSIAVWLIFFGLGAIVLVSSLVATELLLRTIALNKVQHALREGAITYARDMLRLRDNALSEADSALYLNDPDGLSLAALSTGNRRYYNCLNEGCTPISPNSPSSQIPGASNTEYLNASQTFLANLWGNQVQDPGQVDNILKKQCAQNFVSSGFARNPHLTQEELIRRQNEECDLNAIGNINRPLMSLEWFVEADPYKLGVCCPLGETNDDKKDFCVQMRATGRVEPVFLSGVPFLSNLSFIKEASFEIKQRVVAFKGNNMESLRPEQIPAGICAPSIPPVECDPPSFCECEIKDFGDFNESYYLEQNPDVKKLIASQAVQIYEGEVYGPFLSGRDHYVQVGILEGRWCDRCVQSCSPGTPKCNKACNSSQDCSDSTGGDGCTLCDSVQKICKKPECGDTCDTSISCQGSITDCIFCDSVDLKCKIGKCNKKCTSHDDCIVTNDGCSACIGGVCSIPECGTPCHRDEVCQGSILLGPEDACAFCIAGQCDKPNCGNSCSLNKDCYSGNLGDCTYCKNETCILPSCGFSCLADGECAGSQNGCTLCEVDWTENPPECFWDLNNYVSEDNDNVTCVSKGVTGEPGGAICETELDTCIGEVEDLPPNQFPEDASKVSKIFICDCPTKTPSGFAWDVKGRTEANNPNLSVCEERAEDKVSINGAPCSKEEELCKAPPKEGYDDPTHSVKLFICKAQDLSCKLDFQAYGLPGSHSLCSYTGDTIDHSPCSKNQYKDDRCQDHNIKDKSELAKSGVGRKLFRCNCLDYTEKKNIKDLTGMVGNCSEPECMTPCKTHDSCQGSEICKFCIDGLCSSKKCYWDVNNIVTADNNSNPECTDSEPNQKACGIPLDTCLGPIRNDHVPYANDGEEVYKVFRCQCPTNSPTGFVWDLDGRTSSTNSNFLSCQDVISDEGFELNQGSINNTPCSNKNMKCKDGKEKDEEDNVARFVCTEEIDDVCRLDFEAYDPSAEYELCLYQGDTIDHSPCSEGEYQDNLCRSDWSKTWDESMNNSRRELFRCNCLD